MKCPCPKWNAIAGSLLCECEHAPVNHVPREQILEFAKIMERKLRENDHKPDWRKESLGSLIDGLHGEVHELIEAIDTMKSDEDIVLEAADVANFAMFIADKCKNWGHVKRSTEMIISPLDDEIERRR